LNRARTPNKNETDTSAPGRFSYADKHSEHCRPSSHLMDRGRGPEASRPPVVKAVSQQSRSSPCGRQNSLPITRRRRRRNHARQPHTTDTQIGRESQILAG